MSLGAPAYLALLPLALAAALLVAWWAFWRANARTRFGGLRTPTRAVYVAPVALIAAITIIALAAARPRLGSRDVQVQQRGVDLVVVLDVSNSMLADDAKPSRLAQAQTEVGALLDRMQGNRVGLVIFARQPFVRSPLTADLQALRGIVLGVDRERGLVPPGSDLGAAIRGAQRLLDSDAADTKAMLIVSDGEDRGTGVNAAVQDARKASIRVYTAGVGTSQGAPIQDADSATGVLRPRRDASGNPVVTRLDDAALRTIAGTGGGRYIASADGGGSLTSLAAELKDLTQTAFAAKQSSQPIERFQILAALALLLLAGQILWPMLLRPRTTLRSAAKLWPLAGAGLLVGAVCSATVADINRRGNNQYASGAFDAALANYGTAQAKAPSLAELHYNAGNALDRAGQFDKAVEETRRALPARQDLVSRIEYALGNHFAGGGALNDALDAYKRALLADPADADAKHNLEVVTARLTPSPAPTATATPNPEASATALGGTPPSGGTPDTGAATPGGTPGANSNQATPGAGDGTLTREQLERALAEALAGKDKTFTPDEAARALDLLDQANRRAVEDLNKGGNPNQLPDY
jgi:Ca-activated chloride channel family protein